MVNVIKSFDHVAITVKDLDSTIEWYVENMGFTVKRTIENKERGMRIAFLEAGSGATLEFFGFVDPEKVVEGPKLKAEETGIKHISFLVDDLDEMCKRLKSAGVEFTAVTAGRAVFKDPNDIVIEMRLS